MDPLYGSGTEDPLHGNDTLSLCGVLDSCSEISVNKILIQWLLRILRCFWSLILMLCAMAELKFADVKKSSFTYLDNTQSL